VSEWQTVWTILWDRVARDPAPFEIDEVTPEIARRLNLPGPDAAREVGTLLGELGRMPDGEQFLRREGNAIVALPELLDAQRKATAPLDVYPFEL
jgi:hypothetical protein